MILDQYLALSEMMQDRATVTIF